MSCLYAEDGTQAIACLANRPISVVVTDIQMEGMDGLNLVRAIRSQYSSVPVIVMTGHGSEEAAMEALRVGATDYVPKQRLAQDLRSVLARALRTATAGCRRRRCLESLVLRESRFQLSNDPDLIPPLLEFLQDDMTQLDRWDSAELMRVTIALDEALRNALFHGNLEVSSRLREEDDRRYHELAARAGHRESLQGSSHLAPDHPRSLPVAISSSATRDAGLIPRKPTGPSSRRICSVPVAAACCS